MENNERYCATCRHFCRYLMRTAYGESYRATRCVNPKSKREQVKTTTKACRCWSKKILPASGDYCYFIKQRINYDESNFDVKSLPCYDCKARCEFSVSKKERDFTRSFKYRRRFSGEIDDEIYGKGKKK